MQLRLSLVKPRYNCAVGPMSGAKRKPSKWSNSLARENKISMKVRLVQVSQPPASPINSKKLTSSPRMPKLSLVG